MKLSRVLLAVAVLASLAGVGYVSQRPEAPGQKMARAAQLFLESLTADQKAKGTFPFDSKERTNWWFVPKEAQKKPTRKGLPLKEMTDEQKKAALALLAAGTSASGDKQATTIMSLEAILLDLEKGKGPLRDPDYYFFTVFGSPSKNGKWGWRVEGHHLSLNFTLDGGKVLSTTPAFFGANPADVKNGPRKGQVTLPDAENLAIKLFNALDDQQKKVAHRGKAFPEPKQASMYADVGPPTGLAAAKLSKDQRAILRALVASYAKRMPAEVAAAELREIREAGEEKIHFAFTGEAKRGEPHTYRVQGPTFVIEFLNVQSDSAGNPANHIHSCWRRLAGDFAAPPK